MGAQTKQHQAGWYEDDAKIRPSPHFDARPVPEDISLLVIHNISLPKGEFGHPFIDHLFMGCLADHCPQELTELIGLKVSAHFLILRQGALIQYVSTDDRAWHAGVSSFEQRTHCNDFSIGIELEGTDLLPYTQEQYQTLIELTLKLMADYPLIQADRIVGHEHIAPGRKTDPGPSFDWHYYLAQLSQET